MRFLKQVLIASLAGVCIAAAAPIMALEQPVAPEANEMEQLNTSVVDALLAEGTPRSMVLAATSLLTLGEDAKANQQRKYALLKQAARMAPDDAWVQWFAALHADPAENFPESALALQRLEPDNGAVWLFDLQAAMRANDCAGVTVALSRIGSSQYFDDHYVGLALEWLEFFRAHPTSNASGNESGFVSEVQPMAMAFGRANALAKLNYISPTQACKSQGPTLPTDRREACLAAGRLMLAQSNTLVSMRLGAALVRLADAPEAAEVMRNTDYFTRKYHELLRRAEHQDPAEIKRYQADWLQARNELHAAENLLIRASIPLLPPSDWKPEPYPVIATESKAHAD